MSVLRHLPRFRHALSDLPRLAAREGWPRERIESFQLERLNAVWSRAAAEVPHWRELAEREGLPRRFASLAEFRERVPVLEKQRVRDEPERFLAARPDAGGWRRTSGSTGSPTRIYWPLGGHRRVLRSQYRFLQTWGVDPLDRFAFAMRPQLGSLSTLGRGAERMRNAVRMRIRRRRWLWSDRLGAGDVERLVTRLEAFRPSVLYGYSSLVDLIAREVERRGRPVPGLELVVLTSERVPPYAVEAIEGALGVPAVIEYGATECGFIAGEARDRTLRVREDLVFLETAPRPDGRYDILLTVLVNSSFPLLRYAIEDVTDRPLDTPDQGFAVLSSVEGRHDDFLLARGGELLDSAAVEAIVGERPNVRRFRVRQARDGAAHVTVEIADLAAGLDTRAIERDLAQLLGGFPVLARAVVHLEPEPHGKHRVVVSERMRFLTGSEAEGRHAAAV